MSALPYRLAAEILPYHDFPLEVALEQLAGLGFSEINLWSSAHPLAAHVNPGDDPTRIRSLLERFGMRACGLTMYGKSQDEMAERIEFAVELGIDTVIFDCEANYPDFVAKFLPPLVEVASRNGVRIAVENHLTVPFSADFESGVGEEQRWDEGVDTLAQIKRLVTDIDHPNLGVCLAPPHLWVVGVSVSEAITFLAERKRLFYYYIWDIDRAYRRDVDGLNFGPGEQQLPRPDGTLDHSIPLGTLARVGYRGAAGLKCHGTAGWPLEKVTEQLATSSAYVRSVLPGA
ncbi:Xylose isomerase domain-containing protein TIM barrel (plasmid) [Pseudonocardia dioxanivorans CB1190]|uniref:Xylose isomerase domain-containing protein TIM barrel n=1 Tax=Pseudonocardia dioxanivorans (strain ATCC 55486 / DSM 44775 / JCM 13855 / CB1190) TaxID=675635 RepID=F2L735_PSEUX|nr:TIM barrel protein [Pseudonocardia dioxanivorans]AEA29008.1 Xylose isomerase domain-containing protein TIM barrel [Pseudonocardia dioxanivorans CB1190]